VTLRLIQAGKPTQNAYAESFNGKFRDECLNENWFRSLAEAREIIGAWRADYNQRRQHNASATRPPPTSPPPSVSGPGHARQEALKECSPTKTL
jgi:transposase InsO family protein